MNGPIEFSDTARASHVVFGNTRLALVNADAARVYTFLLVLSS